MDYEPVSEQEIAAAEAAKRLANQDERDDIAEGDRSRAGPL